MKNNILLLFTLLVFNSLYAQKSAPIAGNTSELIDLLKKDYATLNPDTRNQDLNRDRAKVISIFKKYLSSNTTSLSTANLSRETTDINSAREDLAGYETELNNLLITKPTLQGARAINANNIKIKDVKIKILNSKKNLASKEWLAHTKEFTNLKAAYVNNDYLLYILSLFETKYGNINSSTTDLFSEFNSSASIQKAIPFIGGDLSFESLIDGLSRFLAKRIKAELTNFVMENIKEELENPNPNSLLNELLVLMPQTTGYIKQFNADEILNFTTEFKQYIENDLNDILVNAANLKSTPRFKKLIDNNPDLGFAFEALDLIPNLSKIKQPVDYIDILMNSETLNNWDDASNKKKHNIFNTLKFVSLLAHGMTIIEDNEIKFVSTEFMSNYGSEPEFFLLLIGFLNQQNLKYYKINFCNTANCNQAIDFKKFMGKLPASTVVAGSNDVKSIIKSISQISDDAEKLFKEAQAIKEASKDDDKKTDAETVHSFVDSFINLLDNIVSSTDQIVSTGKTYDLISSSFTFGLKTSFTPYLKTARTTNSIVLDLQNKKYSSAIISALEIPSNFTNQQNSSSKIFNVIEKISKNSNAKKLYKIIDEYDKLPSDNSEKEKLETLLENLYINSNNLAFKNALDGLLTNLDSKKNYQAKHKALVSVFNGANYDIQNQFFKDFVDTSLEKMLTEITADPTKPTAAKTSFTNSVNTFVGTYINYIIFDKAKSYENKLVSARSGLKKVIRQNFSEILVTTFSIKDKNTVKLIHFINDIAISENSEDVEKALDAFALPTGSYSVKRKAKSNVSINSYPGILGGIDFSKYNNEKGSPGLGFTAPVGIHVNVFSWDGWIEGAHLFIPIIDIGAPVRFRLDGENETKTLPEFKFKNIFTPGVYASFPIRKSPFAFNIGAQYGPELNFEETNSDGNPIANFSEDSFSVNLGVVIDIPLFTIYNRPKN